MPDSPFKLYAGREMPYAEQSPAWRQLNRDDVYAMGALLHGVRHEIFLG
jgi:hypothetical protein